MYLHKNMTKNMTKHMIHVNINNNKEHWQNYIKKNNNYNNS